MTPDPKMSGESFDRPERAEAERIVREEWRPYNLGEIVSLHMEADLEAALIKAREEGRAEERERVAPLIEAATGLSHGTDWNNGTHAKLHGYRQKLLDALSVYRQSEAETKGRK